MTNCIAGNAADVLLYTAVISCVLSAVKVQATAKSDTCPTETFHAECAADEVIVMTAARYGRMQIGRCVKHDVLGYLGCQSDVLTIMDSMCSGRRSCNIRIPDPELEEVSQCLDELKSYLEASFTCFKVIAPMNPCSDTTPIKLNQPEGYLSSYIASTTGCGMEKAPWILTAKPGQLINITFYEFNIVDMDYRESAATAAQCSERAFIMDNQTGRKIKICPRPRRISDVYISTNNTLDVTFRTRSVLEEGNHFLIQYKFIGCEDKAPPTGMVFERTGTMTGILSCLNSAQSFNLVCKDGHWSGNIDNCIELDPVPQDESGDKNIFSGLFLAGLVALCLILSCVIIAIFVFCIRRLRYNNGHMHDTYIYEESPYGKGNKIHTSQCGLKQLHVEMEQCGGGCNSDTDTIYKPFLHKTTPNGMIQNQISVNGGRSATIGGPGEPCLACSDNNRDNTITEEELNLRNAYLHHHQQHNTLPNMPPQHANYNSTHATIYAPKGTPKESNIDNDNRMKQQRKNSTGSSKKDRPMTLFTRNKSSDCLEERLQQHHQQQQQQQQQQHACNQIDYPQYPNQIVYDLAPTAMYPKNYACGPVKQRPREPIYVPPPAPPSVDLLNNTL